MGDMQLRRLPPSAVRLVPLATHDAPPRETTSRGASSAS